MMSASVCCSLATREADGAAVAAEVGGTVKSL